MPHELLQTTEREVKEDSSGLCERRLVAIDSWERQLLPRLANGLKPSAAAAAAQSSFVNHFHCHHHHHHHHHHHQDHHNHDGIISKTA